MGNDYNTGRLLPPVLGGSAHPLVERYLRQVQQVVAQNQTTIDGLNETISALQKKTVTVQNPSTGVTSQAPSSVIENITENTTTTQITQVISSVGNLPGLLAQPQIPLFQVVSSLPNPPSQLAQNGSVLIWNNKLWYYDGTALPNVWHIVPTVGLVLYDTHANRLANFPAATYPPGAVFYETDRTAAYMSTRPGGVPTWTFVWGMMQSASSTLADLPALTAVDTGFLFRSSYFYRVWQWDGSVWHYSDSGLGAGAVVASSGSAPSGGLWQACDGTSVTCALDNATTGSITTPNTSSAGGNNPMIEGGAGGTQQTATVPTLTSGASVSISNDTDAGVVILSAGAASVALHPHTHTASVTDAVVKAPSEANGGLPLRVSMAWWMRR